MIKTKKRLQELYRKGSKFKYTALSSVRDKLAEYSVRAEVSPGKNVYNFAYHSSQKTSTKEKSSRKCYKNDNSSGENDQDTNIL